MLSRLGQSMFYPKGILSQSAEAKSTKYNATIGMATNDKGKMYADTLFDVYNHLSPDEIFPYAPPQGIETLKRFMATKMLKENPSLKASSISRPIVTNALTHGLSLVADLFVNDEDTILLPTHNWGNYKLIFNTRHNANIETYAIFDQDGHYTTNSLVSTLDNFKQDKAIIILNYPNNPTGYTPTQEEVHTIVSAIERLAEKGTKVITVVDDAYYGLFYEDVYTQSIFTAITQLDSKTFYRYALTVQLKIFAWGLRVGFLTFGLNNQKAKDVLEAKVKGLIRSNISSGAMPSQSAIKYILENHEQFDKEIQANVKHYKSVMK